MDISYSPNLPTPDSESDTLHHAQNLEQRLEASQARVCCLIETLPQIVWLAQANGSVTHFNSRWYEYTGLTAEKSLNWAFWQAIHPEARDRLPQSFGVRIATNELDASAPLAHKIIDLWQKYSSDPVCLNSCLLFPVPHSQFPAPKGLGENRQLAPSC